MAIDGNNKLWVSCGMGGFNGTTACPAGSVWIVDLATMQAKPAIDNFATAQGIGYDPTGKYMVLLANYKVWRFKL